jgi:enamine deaminase RidA (YjgF/YER057c/UK114 family)
LLVTKDPDEKLVIANGIEAGRQNHEIPEDSERVFGIMERILLSEGMNFSNIFRQWNYIEDITHVEKESEITSQHYQVFNNIRSKYYAKADFHQGYPSATGIGTRAGGVLVSFYALKQNGYQFFSLENPLQKAAFEYTDEVLIGDSDYEGYSKCTPKFARAKLVSNSETEQVFISGTASIREEQTVGINDVGRQTEITIENILQLISRETLSPISNKVTELPKIEFIRVYIKDQADFKVVKDTCNQMLPGIPGVYVVSDVCREDLLVEIEALASVAY